MYSNILRCTPEVGNVGCGRASAVSRRGWDARVAAVRRDRYVSTHKDVTSVPGFCAHERRRRALLAGLLRASNAQATAKITHLGDAHFSDACYRVCEGEYGGLVSPALKGGGSATMRHYYTPR
jgi:hypothetical protein